MKKCGKCGNWHSRKAGKRFAAYCCACHAAYMRAHRPKHSELRPLARLKASARAYAKVYQRRGKLIPQPCACGSTDVEKHHPDYTKPLLVEWVCKACHR